LLSSELESCLHQAFHEARSAHHEFLTVEHLLLAILRAAAVRAALKGCGADIDQLGADLRRRVAVNTLRWVPMPGEEHSAQPDLGFHRVLRRAVFRVKSGFKAEVGVVDVLVSTFSEKQSHAAFLLKRQEITGVVVTNYVMSLKPPHEFPSGR
jgi:ATP-dependent Clp protease ATP-binding subunit ClpA